MTTALLAVVSLLATLALVVTHKRLANERARVAALSRALTTAQARLAVSARMPAWGGPLPGVIRALSAPLTAARDRVEATRLLAIELSQSMGQPEVDARDVHSILRELRAAAEGASSATRRAARVFSAAGALPVPALEVQIAPDAEAHAADSPEMKRAA